MSAELERRHAEALAAPSRDPVLNEIKFAIFQMAPADQVRVMNCVDQIRAALNAAPDVAMIALALVGAQEAAK
jgi:hypothetical protein